MDISVNPMLEGKNKETDRKKVKQSLEIDISADNLLLENTSKKLIG